VSAKLCLLQEALMVTKSNSYFQARRLAHVNLWVEDLRRSEKFYSEICGLPLDYWEPDLVAGFLGTGHTSHDIGMIQRTDGEPRLGKDGFVQIPAGVGTRPGLNHIAWEAPNEANLVDAYRKMRTTGIGVDMSVDHTIAHSLYLFDPDGNYIEFYCDTVTHWRDVFNGALDNITSGWTPGETEPVTEPRYDTKPQLRIVADAPVHPSRLTHVVLSTEDVPRLRDFYTRIVGLAVMKEALGGTVIYLRGSHEGYACNLIIAKSTGGRGYHHMSFELTDEDALDRSERELQALGLDIATSVDIDWKKSFFLRDPDGMLSEYFVARLGKYDIAPVPADDLLYYV
jgi:catechol 2,3-dioxygenase